MRLGVQYTFRHPEQFGIPGDQLYREAIEQARWVDGNPAFDSISFSEHHFSADGYLPSVLTAAAAVGAVTRRVDLLTNILQLPIHQPVRVAEDALVVDAISGGRLKLGVGLGYREEEFVAFGTNKKERRSRMVEGLEILRLAFAGAPFAFSGRHWSFPEIFVTPGPVRDGGPPIWMGGTAPAALERAARLADGFLAAKDEQVENFIATCDRIGTPPERRGIIRTAFVVIAEDPERAVVELADPILVLMAEYVGYGAFGDRSVPDSAAEAVESGLIEVIDADQAIRMLQDAEAIGVEEFHVFSALPGETIDSGTERLRYLADKVAPAVQP